MGVMSLNPGPEIIKLYSCSTFMSMKIIMLINVKMPTSVGTCWHFNIYEHDKCNL